MDALFWVRVVLGAVMGIAWGAIPLRGWLGFLLFFAINFMSAFGYVNYFQGFYDYEDSSEVSQEGLMPSFGLFMVNYIIFIFNNILKYIILLFIIFFRAFGLLLIHCFIFKLN